MAFYIFCFIYYQSLFEAQTEQQTSWFLALVLCCIFQKSVLESETSGDPNGRIRFDVVRTQGAQGKVVVAWQLTPEATFDIQPTKGNLTFLEVIFDY